MTETLITALDEWIETRRPEPFSKAIVALQTGMMDVIRERDALRKAALPIALRVASGELHSDNGNQESVNLFYVMRKQKQC